MRSYNLYFYFYFIICGWTGPLVQTPREVLSFFYHSIHKDNGHWNWGGAQSQVKKMNFEREREKEGRGLIKERL